MKESILSSEEYMLWVLLAQTRHIISRARDKLIDRRFIPYSQGVALFYIKAIGQEATPSGIARYLFRRNNSVSELLTRMEKKGLVRRVKDLAKKKQVRIVLTEKGQEACAQATRPEFIHEIMSSLTKDQQKQLWSLLNILREKALKALDTEVPFPFGR